MANGLGIERGRTVQANVNTGYSNTYESYQQMADTLKEAGTDLSGSKVSAYEKSEALGGDDDSESESLSIPIVDSDTGDTVGYYGDSGGTITPPTGSRIEVMTTANRKKSESVIDIDLEPTISFGGFDLNIDLVNPAASAVELDLGYYNDFLKGLKAELKKDKIEINYNIPLKAGTRINRAEGGSVPDKDPAQLEMDLILSETKDPVSGNTAPLGATPEEVRDDVPINASPNEFMINAATRRYFGTEFFEELQKSAAEGWKRIKQGEESYFRDDELEVEDDEKGQDKPINMQEGGPVPQPTGGGFGGYGGAGPMFTGFEFKRFSNDDTGQEIVIYFVNGRPLSRLPEGFREKEETPAEEQQVKTTRREDTGSANEGISNEIKSTTSNWQNKKPDTWDNDDFNSYYSGINSDLKKGQSPTDLSKGEEFVTTLLSGPAGALSKIMGAETGIGSLIKKSKQNQAQKVFDYISGLENPTEIQENTKKILGSALGAEGYGTIKELDLSNFSTLLKDIKPKGKYNPADSNLGNYAGSNSNTLLKGEQALFDNAVDNGNDNLVAHFSAINRKNQKQDAYAKANEGKDPSEWENPPAGLSAHDIAQAKKYGGSRSTAIKEGRAANQGVFKEARVIDEEEGDPKKGEGAGDKDDSDCVIATHGISTGGFSRLDKAKAELWCERTYHGKWYGEAFRRGYRHAGNKAIEKGKAAEHYQEFKDFVSYGRGLKKGVKPALNYYLRTAQFFLTGLFVK